MQFSQLFVAVMTPVLLSLSLAGRATAQCSKEEAAKQPKCPSSMDSTISEADRVAKELTKETFDALATNDDFTQRMFDYYMGHACDVLQVQAVLQQMLDWDYGFYCADGGEGNMYNGFCSVVFGKDVQSSDALKPGGFRNCHGKSPDSEIYRILHEISHATKFKREDGSEHWVDDGNDAPIKMPRKSSKGGIHTTCYDIECILANAEKNEKCSNGFNASAYSIFIWSIHCKNGTAEGVAPPGPEAS